MVDNFNVIKPPTGSEVVLLPFSSALWGATCVQTFIYFMHFSEKDAFWTKITVLWLWVADTAHIVLAITGVYSYEITHWGDLQFIEKVANQGFLWSLFFTALVACTVQLFFTRRLWKLNPGNPVIYVLPLLALAQLGLYVVFLVMCYRTLTKASVVAAVNLLLAEWALSATTDVLISGSLLYLIWRIQSNTDSPSTLPSTSRILSRVVVLTVNTGVWTAICSLFSIITATLFKKTPAFIAVAFLICPLYCNTLLANLNMRDTIRGNHFSSPIITHITFADNLNTVEPTSTSRIVGREADDLEATRRRTRNNLSITAVSDETKAVTV